MTRDTAPLAKPTSYLTTILHEHSDGRLCAFLPRLGVWIIDSTTECLRPHPEDKEDL